MINRFLKSIMVGFCVFIITALVAYLAFMYMWKSSASKAAGAFIEATPAAAESFSPLAPDETIPADYYVARYDGSTLSIYAGSGDHEEFLYTLDARIEDISSAELALLRKGIILHDRQALASFEEDFTS